MSPSATSSDSERASGARSRRSTAPGSGVVAALLVAVLVVALATVASPPAAAKVLMTVDEALELAFPGCAVERTTVYLTEEQVRRVAREAGDAFEERVVHPYRATCGGRPGGTAYFDTHRVRTLAETLMVAVDPGGTVRRIEVIRFDEPLDYVPRQPWYDQFLGLELSPELELKRSIQPVTGATLTARATTDAARRVLALHRVLGDGTDGRPETGGARR